MVGARGFLKREGFDFDKNHAQLDKAFLKLFSKEDVDEIAALWALIHTSGASTTLMYKVPKTLKQAHLLMSHDRERYLAGFEWIRAQVAALRPSSVLEVGCGTGVLLRYLDENFPEIKYQGIEAEDGFVQAAKEKSSIELQVGNYLTAPASPEFDLIICNFGFDLDSFPSSKTPHSSAKIGTSQFCLGCSDDLSRNFVTYFNSWRGHATTDARLLVVGRLPDFGDLRAAVIAAEEAGWTVDLNESDMLVVRDGHGKVEHFPALRFVPSTGRAASIEEVEGFYAKGFRR